LKIVVEKNIVLTQMYSYNDQNAKKRYLGYATKYGGAEKRNQK
jgi:hypothetical protein